MSSLNVNSKTIWKRIFWSVAVAVFGDRWHMTHDRWQVTLETWHMTRDWWWTLCKNVMSLALMFWDLWWFEDLEEKDRWLSRSISDGGVCRTAPATPGLLIIFRWSPIIFRPVSCRPVLYRQGCCRPLGCAQWALGQFSAKECNQGTWPVVILTPKLPEN